MHLIPNLEKEFKILCDKLPLEKNQEDRKKRKKLFKDFDPNGNKILSLAEFDKGFRDEMKLESIYRCKPVLLRSQMAVIELKKRRSQRTNKDFRRDLNRSKIVSFASNFSKQSTSYSQSKQSTNQTNNLNNSTFYLEKSHSPEPNKKQLRSQSNIKTIRMDKSKHFNQKPKNISDSNDKSDKINNEKQSTNQNNENEVTETIELNIDSNHDDINKINDNEINDIEDTNNQSPEARLKKLKKKKKQKNSFNNKDFITFGQFRLLLVYLRQQLELFILFTKLDRNEDLRLDLQEFRRGAHMLGCWGIVIDNPVKTFHEIDDNKAGVILQDEFCRWIINKGLYDDDEDDEDADQDLEGQDG